MDKLTREECEQACLYLFGHCYELEREVNNITFVPVGQREASIFKLLIEEHYDNPPLKIEDLKEGMWVWDDKTKSYIYIYKPLDWKPAKGIRYASHIITNSAEGYYMDFEENRFYRREVPQERQENE